MKYKIPLRNVAWPWPVRSQHADMGPSKDITRFCINPVLITGSRISIDSVHTVLLVFPSYVMSPTQPILP